MIKVENLITKQDLPAFFKAFGAGLAVMVLFYLGLGIGAYVAKDKLVEKRQARLAMQTVLIENLSIGQALTKDLPADQHTMPDLDSHETAEEQTITQRPPEETRPETVSKNTGTVVITADPISEQDYYEASATGPLPKLARGHKTVFNLYKYPFDKAMLLEHPAIALVMLDYGLSTKDSEDALGRIKAPVSFVLSPYSRAPSQWTEKAHAKGHEIWMDLPLEPASYPQEDPGPHTLLVGAAEQKNLEKLGWLMSRTKGVIGFVKTGDTAFNNAPTDLRPLLGELYRRGFAYLGDRNDPTDSLARSMAKGNDAPFSARMTVIDSAPNHDSMTAALKELEEEARNHGFAIGVFHPYPVSLALISKWVDQTRNQDAFTLAPASSIAEMRR